MTKEITATHEAGHAVLVLATPFRDFTGHVRIFQDGAEWYGEQHMDGRNRDQIDPHGVLEFARGLAGPMTQLHFFPESVEPALHDLLLQSGGLLEATRSVLHNNLPIQTNWWPDLEAWRAFCLRINLPNWGKDYLAVETAIGHFLNVPEVRATVIQLRNRLIAHDQISRGDLLEIPVDHLPQLAFPPSLSIFH